MSSNAPPSSLSSKVLSIPSPSVPPNYSQTGPAGLADGTSQRRSGSSGSFGSGSSTRTTAQPRSNQPLRKQHKTQRRARLVDDDAIAESTAMKSINSRKGQTSITHLMNFSLPPRPQFHQNHHRFSHGRHSRRNPTWGLGSGYHAADKARYVHANYRFIVKPDREYRTQAVDADVHLEWDSVLQILASAETQLTNCPICLSTPVAPRMAKCGHIFCLPCLIRYMHSTDDTDSLPEKRARWKKCPICEDSIYVSETRPVRWFAGQEANMLQRGGDVLLKLLIREPGSTLALPRDAGERLGPMEDIPWYHTPEITDYARFMKGGEDYMISQYDEEIEQIQNQEKEDELMFGDDTVWTKKAVLAINEAKSRLKGIGNPPETSSQHVDRRPQRPPIVFGSIGETPDQYAFQHTSTIAQPNLGVPNNRERINQTEVTGDMLLESSTGNFRGSSQAITTKEETKPSVPSKQTSIKSSMVSHGRPHGGPFFFYNALPNYYLSPLDIRILKAAFGNFSSFPSTILPRVEHISTGHIIDDDIRKRAKYLAHLPYGCEISFLECDWTDLINPVILAQFSSEIGRRRVKHHEKELREERDRIRAEKEEDDKRWAAARRKRPSFIEKSFSETDFQPLVQNEGVLSMSPSSSHDISTTPPWGAFRPHSSFATLASPGTSPEAPRTVWGTAAVAPISPPLVAEQREPPTADDGWLQGWETDLLDNVDALAIAENRNGGQGTSMLGGASGGRQKKKNKKITLMSTNARRGA